jgi:hypothetical protein
MSTNYQKSLQDFEDLYAKIRAAQTLFARTPVKGGAHYLASLSEMLSSAHLTTYDNPLGLKPDVALLSVLNLSEVRVLLLKALEELLAVQKIWYEAFTKSVESLKADVESISVQSTA